MSLSFFMHNLLGLAIRRAREWQLEDGDGVGFEPRAFWQNASRVQRIIVPAGKICVASRDTALDGFCFFFHPPDPCACPQIFSLFFLKNLAPSLTS